MSVKMRLARHGAKKRPFYWIVVAENRAPRDGRYIEKIGTYNPMIPKDHEGRLTLHSDRAKYWLSVGAQPTERVAHFLGREGLIPMPVARERPKQSFPKQKAQERMKEKEEKRKMAMEAEAAARVAAEQAAAQATASEGVVETNPASMAELESVAQEPQEKGAEPTSSSPSSTDASLTEGH